MIHYNPKKWGNVLFHPYNKNIIAKLTPNTLLFGLYSWGVIYLMSDFLHIEKSTTAIHSLLGVVLGLFLVMRTNTSYERWWEGRKQWGAMVNASRNFAMKLNIMLPQSDMGKRDFYEVMIPNYVFATKEHLRNGVIMEEMDFKYLPETFKQYDHKPNYIANQMYKTLHQSYKDKTISGEQLIVLDEELREFTDILGACERIKNTPIPYSYSMFMKKFIFLYSLTLPMGIASTFGYWSIPVAMLVFYILLSVELIAEEIEDPFGRDDNDLPTDELSVKIKSNVKEIFQIPE
jgi:putative membrane protein